MRNVQLPWRLWGRATEIEMKGQKDSWIRSGVHVSTVSRESRTVLQCKSRAKFWESGGEVGAWTFMGRGRGAARRRHRCAGGRGSSGSAPPTMTDVHPEKLRQAMSLTLPPPATAPAPAAPVPAMVPAIPLAATAPPAAAVAPAQAPAPAPVPSVAPAAPEPPDVLSDESIAHYRAAVPKIGFALQSRRAQTAPRTGDARADFLADLAAFLKENGSELKLRRIGGAELDVYGLYNAVLERGGLQAVILSRAFKMVAKALNLPKSCTSAAFILRVEYEKLLYAYEQKHVWDRDPEQMAQLFPADRVKRIVPPILRPTEYDRRSLSSQSLGLSGMQSVPKTSLRPRRQAALAATNAVASAVSDDPYGFPVFPKRSRLTGLDDTSLSPYEEQIIDDEIVNDNAPHGVYVPGQPGEKERVVSALWSPMHDDVAWALGTLNALSFDVRNIFVAQEFPGILDALYEVLNRYLEDVMRKRSYGVAAGAEEIDSDAPHDVEMAAVDIRNTGHELTGSAIGVSRNPLHEDFLRSSSLQQYPNLFNLADPIAIDRQQCATVAVNVLRNMSFCPRNAAFLALSPQILCISAAMIPNVSVGANLREGLVDMWMNVSPVLTATAGSPGHTVLTTCVKLLDPFKEGAEVSRFTSIAEVLARLAASPERNETALVGTFHELLPRVVDMLSGRNRRYVSAGLAALCNFSAFDWAARDAIARVPRCLDRLVGMLSDAEFAPRAALTLLNLAEAPNNRSVMITHEAVLVEYAMTPSPAAGTVASILFDLSDD